MSPKFRGTPDDWLDDEESSLGQAKNSNKRKRSPVQSILSQDQANGIVAEVFPNQCRVNLFDGGQILCAYRRASILRHSRGKEGLRERTPVTVGDKILAKRTSPQNGVIEGVCERKNQLVRPSPGEQLSKSTTHVIAANLDYLVIVASVKEPAFSIGLVDRFLISATAGGIPAFICVNKVDLMASQQETPWELYQKLRTDLMLVSAKSGEGISELYKLILGKTAAFCGHSGVGKTSLLRTLLGIDIGRIGEVSQVTGKGRHTTTSAILLGGPQNSQWIDTPGIREFKLNVSSEDLIHFYPEFNELKCAEASCDHLDEPGCLARLLPRYASYRRIYESLKAGEG